jgi:hypothetical protein
MVAGVTGRDVANERSTDSSPASQDIKAARRLWEICEALTGFSEQIDERVQTAGAPPSAAVF